MIASRIYELIGRVVVAALRLRYRKQLRIAAASGAGALLLGAFLAARRVPPEG